MPLRSSSEFDPKDLAALEDRIAPDADLARIPGKCFVGHFLCFVGHFFLAKQRHKQRAD
jgi:hypothetical protein